MMMRPKCLDLFDDIWLDSMWMHESFSIKHWNGAFFSCGQIDFYRFTGTDVQNSFFVAKWFFADPWHQQIVLRRGNLRETLSATRERHANENQVPRANISDINLYRWLVGHEEKRIFPLPRRVEILSSVVGARQEIDSRQNIFLYTSMNLRPRAFLNQLIILYLINALWPFWWIKEESNKRRSKNMTYHQIQHRSLSMMKN